MEKREVIASASEETASTNAIMAARMLGYGGLLPFLFLAGAVVLGIRLPLAPAPSLLVGYGAIILSFIGALHWGVMLNANQPKANYFIWSIMPALLAWAALIAPVLLGTGLLIISFIICLFIDLRAIKTGLWPAYMRQLRVILTVMACLSLSANFTLLTF